jgi:hypothetical protein
MTQIAIMPANGATFLSRIIQISKLSNQKFLLKVYAAAIIGTTTENLSLRNQLQQCHFPN